jgi:hypothetical protein
MTTPDQPLADSHPDPRAHTSGKDAIRTPVTANVYERVMRLETSEAIGTCFTLELPGRDQQYLITAAHLLPPPEQDPVHLVMKIRGGTWEGDYTRLPFEVPVPADIAVFAIGWPATTATFPVIPSSQSMVLSQDAYILGYPERVGGTRIRGIEAFAFVKKAIVSALGEPEGVRTIFLDGHSNRGFSGGPVVWSHPDAEHPLIAGVVVGAVPEEVEWWHETDDESITGLTLTSNSGIIVATEIGYAVTAMAQHSIAMFGPFPPDSPIQPERPITP